MVLFVMFSNWITCFSPFSAGNLYPNQWGNYIPISIPFSNIFLLSTDQWEIEYSIWQPSLKDEDLNLHHMQQLSWLNHRFGCNCTFKGVTPSCSSSIQWSRQLEQTAHQVQLYPSITWLKMVGLNQLRNSWDIGKKIYEDVQLSKM